MRTRFENRSHIAYQGIKYVLVGVAIYAIEVFVFLLLTNIDFVNYLYANGFAKVIAAGCGFFLHKHITFSWDQAGSIKPQLVKYVSLLIFNLCLANALLYLSVDVMGWHVLLMKVITDAIVIVLAFLVSRSFIFGSKAQN